MADGERSALRPPHDEADELEARYARRRSVDRYRPFNPDVWMTVQERQRAMLRLLARQRLLDFAMLDLVEVGCGAGGNLLELLRLGFDPARLVGIELIAERYALARRSLPQALRLYCAEASTVDLEPASQDIVYVSTVFSSLLDAAFQERLAAAIWSWVRPGGGVLWYDFTVDNPRNPDVRGVPLRRVRALFPSGAVEASRVTLAPPLARAVVRLHPALYTAFNVFPPLRTHVLAWIGKP